MTTTPALESVQRTIEVADATHFSGLLELIRHLSPCPEPSIAKKILGDIMRNPDQLLIVSVAEDQVIGTAELLLRPNLSHGGRPAGYIENVVTHPDYRGNGVGREMIDHLVQTAEKKGCYKVTLSCSDGNVPFYEKCGFRKTDENQMRRDFQ